jgi:hypothetical protein
MELPSSSSHVRSNSTPLPESEALLLTSGVDDPMIPSSVSMILPCGSSDLAMCGLSDALEGFLGPQDETDYHNHHHAGGATGDSSPTTEEDVAEDHPLSTLTPHHATTASSSTPPLTPSAVERRGRFTIWPVSLESPMGLPLMGV